MRFIYKKNFVIFASCLFIVFILTLFYHKGWLSFIQKVLLQVPRPINIVLSKVTRPIQTFFITVYDLRAITKENTKLKEQVWKLQSQQVLFDQYSLENQQLKKELGFVKTSKLNLEPCNVIARNPTGLTDIITINCGTNQGADLGRAVLSQGYLAGKIIYSAPNFSTVQLVSNAGFSIDAKISSSGRLAVVKGSFNSGLVVEQISQDEPLDKGVLVITAGVNEKVPKNILIGEIGEILSGQNDLFKSAVINTPVNLGSLDLVFLVK